MADDRQPIARPSESLPDTGSSPAPTPPRPGPVWANEHVPMPRTPDPNAWRSPQPPPLASWAPGGLPPEAWRQPSQWDQSRDWPQQSWQPWQPQNPWPAQPWPAQPSWPPPNPWPAQPWPPRPLPQWQPVAYRSPAPQPLPVGAVPWGFSVPPPLAPVIEPPGRFHPRRPWSVRSIIGQNRRLSVLALAFGLPAGLALLAIEVAARGGFKFVGTPLPGWAIVEIVSATAAIGLIAACLGQAARRRADGWRDFAGPSPFLMIATQQAVAIALAEPIAVLLSNLDVATNSGLGLLLIIPLYLAVYLGLVHFLVVRTGGLNWREVLRPTRLAPSLDDWSSQALAERLGWRAPTTLLRRWLKTYLGDFLLAAAILVPVLIATALTNLALIAFLNLSTDQLPSDVPIHPSQIDEIITFVTIAVLTPIGEEIFFRGYATNAWARSLSRSSALLRGGLVFAFIHVVNTTASDPWLALRAGVFNFGARVPVALALTWLFLRRRSLAASVSLHGLYNGLIVLVAIFRV